ncbi:MAG: hypothetical protein ACK4SJ_07075 [Sphingorhabdus sp.]
MQRQLVQSSEGAQHPFRQVLAPHVLAIPAQWKPKAEKWWQSEDTHLFLISFGAFFTVFYTFIA